MPRPNLLILLKARIKEDPKKREALLVKLTRAIKQIPGLDIHSFWSDINERK